MSNSRVSKCWLKSLTNSHPHIEINSDDVYIGRTRQTCLTDTMVSKKHLKIRADFNKQCIFIEMLGLNVSVLNGKMLKRNTQYAAINGDTIEIIQSKYPYKVHFEIQEANKNDNSTTESDYRNKRKRSVDICEPKNLIFSKKMKWRFDIYFDAKSPFPGEKTWESFNNGQLIVYTMAKCRGSDKIAAYDMDGTLISTKSGKVFPISADDWKLAFGNVISTLKEKHHDNYKIVIFTNQAGISKGKTKLIDIKNKIQNISKVLGVPIQAFIATGDNHFRKPLMGMWQTLCDHKNDGYSVNMERSFYVGDAAGRPEIKALKKKKDHSTVDRLFALNLGLSFYTPEEHFMNTPRQKWIDPEFNPKAMLAESINLTESPSISIISNELEVIVMVGGPGSGKSRFCKDFLEQNKYEIVSRDIIGSWQKCVDRLNDCLKMNRKVVIDNTNGDRESRVRYVNAAKKNKVPCRCFVMMTTFKHAEHNNAFRELTDPKHAKINKIVLNSYKKHYKHPTLEEGFTEIVRLNFVPKFRDENDKYLYGLYLLSS